MADQPIELMPLETLHADAAYLVGRAVNGSMGPDEVVAVIRSRIDAARAALAAQGQDAEPVAWRIPANAMPGRYITFDYHPGPAYQNAQPLYAHPPRAQAEPPGNAGDLPEALTPARPDLDYLRSMATGSVLPAMLRGQIMAAVRVIDASAALAQQPGGQAQQYADSKPLIERQLTPYGMIVRGARLLVGTTLYEMAQECGFSSAHLSGIEVGRKKPDANTASAVQRFFRSRGLDLDDVIDAARREQP